VRATPPRLHARPPGLTNTRFDHCTSTGQKTARQAACRLPPAAAGEHPRRTAFPARAPAPPRAVRRPPESPPPAAARPAPPLESAKRPPPAPLPVRVTIGRGGGRGKRAPACPTRKSQPQRRAHERQTPREHKNPHARARTCTQTPRASVPAAPTPPALRHTCRRPASAVPPRRPVDLHHPPASHASTPPLIVARRHRAAHRQGFVIASTPPLIDEVNISSSGRCPRARPPPRVSVVSPRTIQIPAGEQVAIHSASRGPRYGEISMCRLHFFRVRSTFLPRLLKLTSFLPRPGRKQSARACGQLHNAPRDVAVPRTSRN
jgi:hypothetical protein